MIEVGQKIEGFVARTSRGEELAASELEGRAFVAYFYPRSFTPGCTVETRNFAQLYPEFLEMGVEVLGISMDGVETQCRFAEELGAEFPILDDSGNDVARAFGMRKRLFGGYKRVTFVVDEQGAVEKIFKVGFDWSNHPREVLDYMASRLGQA